MLVDLCHGLWIVSERIEMQMQELEMSFHWSVSEMGAWSYRRREATTPPHQKETVEMVWLGCPMPSSVRVFHSPTGERPGPNLANGDIMFQGSLKKISVSFWKSWRQWVWVFLPTLLSWNWMDECRVGVNTMWQNAISYC